MSYTVTKYPDGTFCWAEAASTNAQATRQFMQNVFGWDAEEKKTPNGTYTMFRMDGKAIAGLTQIPAEETETPSHWNSFVSVSDVEAATQKAADLGAIAFMETVDVEGSGKLSGIIDPTGAALMLWQPTGHIGAEIVNTVGAMGWNELATSDWKTAGNFYSDLFGWNFNFEEEGNYAEILNGDRMNGGMLEIQPEWGDVPSHWNVYFTVANLDETLKKVEENGGESGEVMDVPVGRFAMVVDTTGAMFTVIEMKQEPDHWTE